MLPHANANSSAPSATSIAEYVAGRCRRQPAGAADKVERILELAAAGAWTDAALTLVELEQPEWKLRRLAHEDGQWFCCLSRRPELPIEMDDTAEANNALLPLAILDALAEAREKNVIEWRKRAPAVSNPQSPSAVVPACDNFD